MYTTDKTQAVQDIVAYLNQKANRDYRPGTPKTQRLIKARINEGFTVADFFKVIDFKTADWLHKPDMQQYLRPETLFGTKFEGYLNAAPKNLPTEHELKMRNAC